MHFGVCLPNFPFGVRPSRDHIVAIAQAAERLHYASVWVSDHVLVPTDKPRYGQLYEVLTTLAYIAGITERIRLGTSVLVLPQRQAILAAKQIATLDDLSGGRVIVGVGAGWMEGEFANLGADFHRRGRHLDEGIHVMQALWRDETPQHAGSFYRFTDVLFGPKPSQAGGPAIWIGGASAAALRRAARLGDGWHADDVPLEQLHPLVAQLRRLAAQQQRSVEVSLRRTIDVRPAAAAGGLLPAPATGGGVHAGRWPGSNTGALTGTLEDISEFVDRLADIGVSHLICQFEHTTQAEHLAQMEWLAREILPRYSTPR
jgi:probable F420-dependent oxidoreductase